MGGFPRAHWYNYAIRSRGSWDLGNKDDGICYECNWKMVKSGRFCTRTCLLLSLSIETYRKKETAVIF